MTKFGGNRSEHVEAISLGSVARRRKKKKKETSKIQYPAGYSGRVRRRKKRVRYNTLADTPAG